jgi:hypothetical protein
MWIIPRNLQLSSGAPDTAGFISDLNEQSQICASSLMVRSKASPARTWLQKWKRDSWTQHLSGRILRPSHARTFVTEWTSLWPVTPASHFQQPGSDLEQKTLATYGHTSPDQYELFDLDYASLRMSKDTSASDSEKSLESWNQSVIKVRLEYSARLKSAHRTSGSASSSWPTIRASEYKDTGPIGSKSHDHMLGKGYLCAVVTQDAANWPTPNCMDVITPTRDLTNMESKGHWGKQPRNRPDGVGFIAPNTGKLSEMVKYGQAAPASPSTDGSRQGLSEQSQRNWQTFAHGTHNRGETPHRQVVKALVNGDKAKTQCLTVDQVFAEEIKGTNRPESWATPNAFCYQPPENTEQWTKRAEYQQTEKGVNLHKPIQTQVLHEVEKMWRTPSVAEEKNQNTSTQIYLQNQVGATPKAWATPRVGGEEKAETRLARGKDIGLHGQVGAMNNTAKLNPRWVETLMGLPVGWVMPSCKSPVTIEQTNFDSSETESCLQPPSEHSELFGRNSND